jgi:hypothetical protein
MDSELFLFYESIFCIFVRINIEYQLLKVNYKNFCWHINTDYKLTSELLIYRGCSWVFSVRPGKCQNSTLKQAMSGGGEAMMLLPLHIPGAPMFILLRQLTRTVKRHDTGKSLSGGGLILTMLARLTL